MQTRLARTTCYSSLKLANMLSTQTHWPTVHCQHQVTRANSQYLLLPWLFAVLMLWGCSSSATAAPTELNDKQVAELLESPTTFIDAHIREDFDFAGLANYYQAISYYRVAKESIEPITSDQQQLLEQQHWLAIVGRFKVLLINAPTLSLKINEEQPQLALPAATDASRTRAVVAYKHQLPALATALVPGQSFALDHLRYAHLWTPLAWLTKQVEAVLVSIQSHLVSNWGWAIVVLAVAIKLLLLPLSIKTVGYQRQVSHIQAQLAPKLTAIKARYDGEEAHNQLMAAHRALGVSPFYSLKPLMGTLVQLPILIAVFNALAEMPQLGGQPFLWVSNLAYPDQLASLGQAIPLFGSSVSLLPLLMTLIALCSTVVFKNRYAEITEIKRQKRNLYLMAALFFVLFYPFPAAMVLYWLSANALHAIQQQWVKI